MVRFAKSQGIKDKELLQGKMSFETCKILSESKIKHRSCKFFFCLFLFSSFCHVALKLTDWCRDNYYKRQKEILEPTLRIAMQVESNCSQFERTGVRFPDFIDNIERVQYG
jgi:hypothetical protein